VERLQLVFFNVLLAAFALVAVVLALAMVPVFVTQNFVAAANH
jgi:hypothetical protein